MRKVKWIDRSGWERVSLLRDEDPDEDAPLGVPVEMPDVEQVDWETVKRELHNALVQNGLFDYNDLVINQNGLPPLIAAIIKRQLVTLYKLQKKRYEEEQT
jgi:hypothetical protein